MKGLGPKHYTIELGRGETYRNGRWTVYGHDRYPSTSVLAGQDRRTWVQDYDSLELAQAAYPHAQTLDAPGATTWRPIREIVAHLPDEPDY